MTDLRRATFPVRRALARRRRSVAAVLAGLTVLAVVRVLAPPPAPTVEVLVARHDVLAGQRLGSDDVRVRRLAVDSVPATAMRRPVDVVGRTAAGPIGDDEVITDSRLVGPGLVAGLGDGLVAAPVRMADRDAVRLLDAGDRIDVYAPTASGLSAPAIVRSALVATLPQPDPSDGVGAAGETGALVVLAVDAYDAGRLAQQSARTPLSFTVLG
jgi:Flp pilus assembly protein CpaB